MKYIGKLNDFQTQQSSPLIVILTSTTGQRITIAEDEKGNFNIKFE